MYIVIAAELEHTDCDGKHVQPGDVLRVYEVPIPRGLCSVKITSTMPKWAWGGPEVKLYDVVERGR